LENKNICLKCIFEGKLSGLSKPKKTEKGWIQRCERGHKLYIWFHFVQLPNVIVDLLGGEIYPFGGGSKN